MQVKEIKIVSVGNYVGAVKSGKCPMYGFAPKVNKADFLASLKEDFPEYRFICGGEKERSALMFNIKLSERAKSGQI